MILHVAERPKQAGAQIVRRLEEAIVSRLAARVMPEAFLRIEFGRVLR